MTWYILRKLQLQKNRHNNTANSVNYLQTKKNQKNKMNKKPTNKLLKKVHHNQVKLSEIHYGLDI